MSRAYRIRVSESLERHVHIKDGVATQLDLLPVLSKPRMGQLLLDELKARGYTEKDGKAVRTDPDGVEISIDPATGEVAITLKAETDIKLNADRTSTVAEERSAGAEEELRGRVKKELERTAEREEKALEAEVAAKLERRLHDLQQELDQISSRVTGTALKERAASLGEIEEITEDPESGQVTIKVRV
jgi:hypothetical protein